MRNRWKDAVLGVAVGDALGCPVQFLSREEISRKGMVTKMTGHGTYDMPAGSWTDDTSMTLAALDAMNQSGFDKAAIMEAFCRWYDDGEYTPFGFPYDMGGTCSRAIEAYERKKDPETCGQNEVFSNGNGSLMRIIPAVLLAYSEHGKKDEAIRMVEACSALTHAHLRSRMACGIYAFIVMNVLERGGRSLSECLTAGLSEAAEYYAKRPDAAGEMSHYQRIFQEDFKETEKSLIKSSGYVVDSLEAAVWCLFRTRTLEECLIEAVNLGEDTDTVAAIAGGIAGLYYGADAIPASWMEALKNTECILRICEEADRQRPIS